MAKDEVARLPLPDYIASEEDPKWARHDDDKPREDDAGGPFSAFCAMSLSIATRFRVLPHEVKTNGTLWH